MGMIPFTQFLRPDGRPKAVHIERPDDVYAKAMEIVDAGFCFECEELATGEVSLTISDGEVDVAIELVPNGPDVPCAVDRMILGFSIPSAAR